MSFFNLSAKKSGSSAAQKGSKASNTPTTSNSKSTPLQQYAEETLSESRGCVCESRRTDAPADSGNLRLAVTLPEGEDLNEWLAVNTVDFFNQVNMLYGTVTEFCTAQTCPSMSAGPK
jgi:hypothetical protein